MQNKYLILCFFMLALTGFCPGIYADFASIKDPAALLENELTRLDRLIQATQRSLECEIKLREQIVEYKKIQEEYLKRPEDNDLLFKMIKSAHRTIKSIKENHLTESFDPEFIDELTVLAQAANKRGVPKP